MPYLPVAGLPVVGALNSTMNGVAPEGAVVAPAFNALLGRYAPVSYQYLPVASPAAISPVAGTPAAVTTQAYIMMAPPPPTMLSSLLNQGSGSSVDPVWTHEVKDGKATINLGDKYTITVDEKDGTSTVRNKQTGHVTKIHGDPHVDADGDGKDDFDFKKAMTFQLDDGTKITVNNVDYGNGEAICSKLTITNDHNAIVVEGLGDDKDGKNNLRVTQSNAGMTLDMLTADGVQTIHESGQGWADGAGRAVNQASIDAGEQGRGPGNDPYANQAPAAEAPVFFAPPPPPPPLAMVPVAVAQTPAQASQQSSQPTPVWSHEVKDCKAIINLGDKYTITADEKDGTWTVRNNQTGHVTKIHGDPHVDANGDGKDDFDFKKGMTFQLDDGTKITADTVDFGKGKTICSKLTITNGDNAMVVEGLGGDKDGKNNLKVTQSNAGRTLDQLASDGAQTIHESGQGWVDGAGRAVNQASIDAGEQGRGPGNDPYANQAPAAEAPAFFAPPPPPPPLAMVPVAVAQTPAQASQQSSQPTPVWSHEVKDCKAIINLGDKYTITADEKDGTWTVRNNQTGHVTKIHGDPHVDANGDGKDDFDFKKGMTFQLDDGTKITADTVDFGKGKTICSKLTITNGDNAMVVEGLGGDKDGKNNLKVTQSNAGRTLDQLASDGAQTIHESGQGWVDGAGRMVTQSVIDHHENPDAPPDFKAMMREMMLRRVA